MGFWAMAVVTAGLYAFTALDNATIRGEVIQADYAVKALAISPTDTAQAEIINGSFTLSDLKPDTYQVTIEAKPPYKNLVKEDVRVPENGTVDLGKLELPQ